MLELLQKIEDLSNYSFRLGIANSTLDIELNDDETVKSDDFLRMLENGSPLHNILATRPIEQTWLTLKDEIARTYEECIGLIITSEKTIVIEDRLRALANRLKHQLQMNVDNRIRNQITCQVFYKGRKIN